MTSVAAAASASRTWVATRTAPSRRWSAAVATATSVNPSVTHSATQARSSWVPTAGTWASSGRLSRKSLPDR